MKVRDLLGLGTRLTLGGRGAKLRFGLTAAGVAMGTALLLGALGAWVGLEAKEERARARSCLCDESDRIPPDSTLWVPISDRFFDRNLAINVVAALGDAPVPPGIDRLPRPGEVFVSPALRDILEGPAGHLLRTRLPARVVGTIAPEGLVEPGELTAYLGSTAREIRPRAAPVTRWGHEPTEDAGDLDLAVIQTLVFGTAALLVPILVFIWTATRLSAARREERLAAIRLVGGTPGQVRLLAAVETALASTTGAIGGFLLFLAGRQVAPSLLPPGARLFPQDIAPPVGAAVAAIVLVPVLSVLVGWLALRKVAREPMRVVRKARRGSWIAVPSAISLGLGLALWLGVGQASRWIGDNGELQATYRLSAWVLTAAGVLGVSPWVGSRAAAGLALLVKGVGPWLGARRLAHDPGAAGRVSAGVVVVVFAASVTLGYLMILGEISGWGGARETLREEAVSVEVHRPGGAPSAFAALSSIEGVGTTVPVRLLEGHGRGSLEVAVLSCERLASVVDSTPPGCAPAAVMLSDRWILGDVIERRALEPGRSLPLRTRQGALVGSVHIPRAPRMTQIPTLEFVPILIDEAAVSRRTIAAGPISKLLIQTDGRPETVERIREELAALLPPGSWYVSTRAMLLESQSGSGGAVAAAVRIGTIIALAVAAASMLTSTIGAIQDRRRPLAALAAVGAPRRALLWSTAVQTMSPLLAGTVLAAGAAMIVVASTASTIGEVSDTVPTITPTLPFVGFALVAGIAATLLAMPSLGRGISPDALHRE